MICVCLVVFNRVCPVPPNKMVGRLEAELEGYENVSGKRFSAEKPTTFQVREAGGLVVLDTTVHGAFVSDRDIEWLDGITVDCYHKTCTLLERGTYTYAPICSHTYWAIRCCAHVWVHMASN